MAAPINFDQDFNDLQDAANAWNQATQALADAKAEYTKRIQGMAEQNPDLAFYLLFYILATSGFQELDGSLAVNGYALKVQGALTKIGNDLEKLSNSGSTDQNDVKNFTQQIDKLLDVFNNQGPSGGQPEDWYKYVGQALGDTATNALLGQFTAIRKDIYWAGDTGHEAYNPTAVGQPNGVYSYHFEIDDGNMPSYQYMHSFGDRQYFMSQKGDKYQANESAKLWSDSFNTATSTTQSVQAATNQLITFITNTQKTIQAFVTAMMHSVADVVKLSVQSQTRA